jgi:hypothetical protein
LKYEQELLFVYLHALFAKYPNECTEYHDTLVSLYAEYDPASMLGFLRESTNYSYQKAYEICRERDMVPEMLFLLGKLGDNRTALYIIIDRLHDVEMVYNTLI